MDKYVINAGADGRINWVGVNTDKGFEVIEIEESSNPTKYVEQLQTINKVYGGDFISSLNRNEVKVVSKRYIAKKHVESVVPATKNIKRKVLAKRIAAVAAAVLVFIGAKAYVNGKGIDFKSIPKNISNKLSTISLFGNDKDKNGENEDLSELDLENKSVQELISMLDVDQEEAFNKIVNTQDYFNEVAAPTVSQGDKQLFFTFDETTAAYLYANAKAVSSDKLANIFGTSKIMLLNEETGEYEQMDKDTVAAKYLSFNLNLSYYYQLGATERSGVDGLFENEKEAEFFRDFEAKILEYNRTKSKKTAAEIRAMLEDIFMSGNVDTLMDKYPGASSIIGTSIVPYLYLNGVIDKDMYNSLVEINEKITCQDIYSQIEKIVNCKVKENGKEAIIEAIAKLQNEKTADLDRNVSLMESLDGYKLSDLDLDGAVLSSAPGFSKSKTITKHYRKATKDRNEAIRKTSKKAVRKAEKEADRKAGIDEKNQNENDYWDGYTAGYNKAYDSVMAGGSGNVSVPSGSAKYVEGFKAGVAAGKKYAKQDLEKIKKDKEDYDKNHKPKEETISDEVIEDKDNTNNNNNNNHNNNNNNNNNNNHNNNNNNNNNNDNNNNDNSNSNSNNNSGSTSGGSSNPEPETHIEVVEDTFVYESDEPKASKSSEAPKASAPEAPKAQKVVKVESHENNDSKKMSITLEDGTELESEAKVLVRE